MRNTGIANTVAGEKSNTKFRCIQDIMKDPVLKARLNNMVDEAVICKRKIYEQQQAIKDLRDLAKNEVGLNPKHFNYYVAMIHNNDYAQRLDDVSQLETLIETVMRLGLTDDIPTVE